MNPLKQPTNLDGLSDNRRKRWDAVRVAIRQAWKSYAAYSPSLLQTKQECGFVHDDANPLSKISGNSWLFHAATLHDALDTLYLAGWKDEFGDAVEWLLQHNIQTTTTVALGSSFTRHYPPTKTFEYHLRVVGGLLGAYSVSADTRLLRVAREAADAMLEGPFSTTRGKILPRIYDILAPSWKSQPLGIIDCVWVFFYRLYASIYRWGRDVFTEEHHINSLAGVGSFGLEFLYLTKTIGDPQYHQASQAIFHHVTRNSGGANSAAESAWEVDNADVPMVPNSWNVMTGEPSNLYTNLGSGSDSFYEYLVKIPWLLTDSCNDLPNDGGSAQEKKFADGHHNATTHLCNEYQRLYNKVLETLPSRHISTHENVSYPTDMKTFNHLLCFIPAMVALGARVHTPNSFDDVADPSSHTTKSLSSKRQQQEMASNLLHGCYKAYSQTATGLGPERMRISPHLTIVDPSYFLRPEYVESLFVMYRLTKEEKYQEWGWNVFQSLQSYCKIPDGGFAGLRDVNNISVDDALLGMFDDTPSYFLSETLKYLLLLFAPDDYVSLEDFVFTTEGHPLRRLVNLTQTDQCQLDTISNRSVPVPWFVLAVLTLALVMISFCLRVTLLCCGCREGLWQPKSYQKRKDQ